MKRLLCWMLFTFMVIGSFGMLGCKTAENAAEPAQTAVAAEEPTPTATVEPTPEPVFYGADVSQAGIDQESNIMNFNCFTYNAGWIYGQTWADAGYSLLTGFRADGSETTKLDIGLALNVLYNDGYVYYTMMRETSQGIYRMTTDGTQMNILLDAFGEFQIVGDQLYYADQSYQYSDEFAQSGATMLPTDTCHLFRCNLDGTGSVEIIAKPTFYFYVLGNAILYQDDNDGSSLHVCNLDGSGDRKIADGFAYCPIYDGEYVYYLKTDANDESASGIWRVRSDGTEESVVAKRNADGGILLRGDSIYYINEDDNGRIYRIGKDGTGDTPISQDAYVGRMQFLGEGLEYSAYTSDYSGVVGNFLCTLDGENPKELK